MLYGLYYWFYFKAFSFLFYIHFFHIRSQTSTISGRLSVNIGRETKKMNCVGEMSHWVVGIQNISTTSLPSSDACAAKGQKPTVMSGTHRFNTSYSAEGAGKVVFKHCHRVIYLPKRYVEQMSDRVKSLGWSLQLLSSLWCFSEAVLPVFIHLPLWVTAEQLQKKGKKLHDS